MYKIIIYSISIFYLSIMISGCKDKYECDGYNYQEVLNQSKVWGASEYMAQNFGQKIHRKMDDLVRITQSEFEKKYKSIFIRYDSLGKNTIQFYGNNEGISRSTYDTGAGIESTVIYSTKSKIVYDEFYSYLKHNLGLSFTNQDAKGLWYKKHAVGPNEVNYILTFSLQKCGYRIEISNLVRHPKGFYD